MRTIALCSLAFAAGFAAADYVPTSVRWHRWQISSSEDFGGSAKYPLINLVDGDPRTAWVYRKSQTPPEIAQELRGWWGGKYGLGIEFMDDPADPNPYSRRTQVLDGIDIMNGYNKSPEIFRRNNRVVEVTIYEQSVESPPIKTVALSDKMGWHHISLPKRAYSGLVLSFTGIRKGADDDVAISELRLTLGGRPISMGLGKAYLATSGSECG